MRSYKKELEAIANDLLIQNGNKPNYSNRLLHDRSFFLAWAIK